MIQRCSSCGRNVFYPRAVCPHCISDALDWVRASGLGTIYSYTTVHRTSEEFRNEIPFHIGLVDLEEDGVRMMARLDIAKPAIGMQVRVVFEPISDKLALPHFKEVD